MFQHAKDTREEDNSIPPLLVLSYLLNAKILNRKEPENS